MWQKRSDSDRASFTIPLIVFRLEATFRTSPNSRLVIAEVFQDLIVKKGHSVADAEVILVKRETIPRSYRFPRDREVSSADFLPTICVHPLTRGTNER